MPSTSNKIISFFIRHPQYFHDIVSWKYPFNYQQLKKYGDVLDWYNISDNSNINWDFQIMNSFPDLLRWDILTTNPSAFKDIALLDKFAHRFNWKRDTEFRDTTIAANYGLPWTMELIEKYENKLDFKELSINRKVPWTEHLIDKYIDRWDFNKFCENENLPWSISFFNKYYNKTYFENFWLRLHLTRHSDLEIIEKYHPLMDWDSICLNGELPWLEKNLLERWEDNIDWPMIAENELLFKIPGFFEKHLDKWNADSKAAFSSLSRNKVLPWSADLLERFFNDWNWESLSSNPALPWDIEFIDRYADYLSWGGLERDIDFLLEDYVADGSSWKTGEMKYGLISNKGLPWSIDFLIYYEDKLDFGMLRLNKSVWDMAFKQYMDEHIIDTVLGVI